RPHAHGRSGRARPLPRRSASAPARRGPGDPRRGRGGESRARGPPRGAPARTRAHPPPLQCPPPGHPWLPHPGRGDPRGARAPAGYGTAVGVIRAAHERGRVAMVWVDETRPVMQGSRLTAWEMVKEGIPHRLISDVAAGFVMKRGEVDLVVTGADRIAAN